MTTLHTPSVSAPVNPLDGVIADENAIHTDFFSRAAYAPDASHYLLTPEHYGLRTQLLPGL